VSEVLFKVLMGKDMAGRREVGQQGCQRQGGNDEDPLQPHKLAQATANPRCLIGPCPDEPDAAKATDRCRQ
jgi:hypothetical protein